MRFSFWSIWPQCSPSFKRQPGSHRTTFPTAIQAADINES